MRMLFMLFACIQCAVFVGCRPQVSVDQKYAASVSGLKSFLSTKDDAVWGADVFGVILRELEAIGPTGLGDTRIVSVAMDMDSGRCAVHWIGRNPLVDGIKVVSAAGEYLHVFDEFELDYQRLQAARAVHGGTTFLVPVELFHEATFILCYDGSVVPGSTWRSEK